MDILILMSIIPLESYIYDLLLYDIYETIPIRDVYEKCL